MQFYFDQLLYVKLKSLKFVQENLDKSDESISKYIGVSI